MAAAWSPRPPLRPGNAWHQTWPLPSLVKAWPREEGETEAQRGGASKPGPAPALGCCSRKGPRWSHPPAAIPAPFGDFTHVRLWGQLHAPGLVREGEGGQASAPRSQERGPLGLLACGSPGPEVRPQLLRGQLQGLGERCDRLCLSFLTCRLVQEPRKGSGAHTQQNAASGETGPLIRRFRGTRARLLPRKLCVPELGADPVVHAQSRPGGLHARVRSYRKPLGLALFPCL